MALSKDIATSAGLQCESNRTATTANGTAAGCETTVSNLTIGSITVHNVKAIIMPNMMQEALLGMNVLGKFKVEHENGTMKLSSAPSR
jgi:aspartyl protease family protein